MAVPEWWPTADGGLEYYRHTDEATPRRWSPFCCNELMRAQPWELVEGFYERVAAGTASLNDLRPLNQGVDNTSCRSSQLLDHNGQTYEDKDPSSNQERSSDIPSETSEDLLNGAVSFARESEVATARGSSDCDQPPLLSCASKISERVPSESAADLNKSAPPRGNERCMQSDAHEQEAEHITQGQLKGGKQTVKSSERQFERRNFKIQLAYSGRHFWGWQKQTGHETVQDPLERALRSVLDHRDGSAGEARLREAPAERKAKKKAPVETTNASVAGRTDKGVSACGQVVSWYTRYADVDCDEIADRIDQEAPGVLRAVKVTPVDRSFHAQFSAKWRSYAYLFPLSPGELQSDGSILLQPPGSAAPHQPRGTVNKIQPSVLDVRIVDKMMCALEGKSISYGSYARDTRSDRSSGAAVICHLFKARADLVTLPLPTQDPPLKRLPAVRFALVGNRFLHRMVRVLVATAIREAAAGAPCTDALLRLASLNCRRATAPPAPPQGLILAEVGYEQYRE